MKKIAFLAALTILYISEPAQAVPGFGDVGFGAEFDATSIAGKLTFKKVANFGITADTDKQILGEIKSLADADQPEALNVMGWLLDNGYFGVKQNSTLAAQYFVKSANGGLDVARYNLATQYFWGRGLPQSNSKALDLLNQITIKDTDGKICGLKSYIHFRNGKREDAFKIAQGCKESGLALISLAYGTTELRQRNDYATRYAAISPEIYPLMISTANKTPAPERETCVWSVLASSYNRSTLKNNACLSKWRGATENAQAEAGQLKQKIEGARPLYNFSYARSIPYTPFFSQNEVAIEKYFHNSPAELRAKQP